MGVSIVRLNSLMERIPFSLAKTGCVTTILAATITSAFGVTPPYQDGLIDDRSFSNANIAAQKEKNARFLEFHTDICVYPKKIRQSSVCIDGVYGPRITSLSQNFRRNVGKLSEQYFLFRKHPHTHGRFFYAGPTEWVKFESFQKHDFKASPIPSRQQSGVWRLEITMSDMAEANADPKTIYVSSAEELMTALENTTGGETILLAPGNYGELGLYDARQPFSNFPSEVTISSADPNNKAVFDGLNLTGVENLTIDNVVFDYTFQEGDHSRTLPFRINGESSGIKITNSEFDGDVGSGLGEAFDGAGIAFGLTVRDSSDITVDGNTFSNFHRGATFGSIDNLVVSNNEISNMSTDGLNFAEVDNVLIEGNYIHDFYKPEASGAHMDMIQFWTAGTDEPSTNITIRGNFLDSGEGTESQSIFMRNELVDSYGAGEEMFYQNVVIEDNVILNAHAHGITVGETDGLTIKNNTLLHNADTADGAQGSVPIIQTWEASKNVIITHNVTPRIMERVNPNHVVQDNVLVQRDDADQQNYYGDVFVNGLADSRATLDDLKIVPGSAADGYGSSLTAFDTSPEEYAGYIKESTEPGLNALSVTYDASNVFGASGALDLSKAKVIWNFGDGSTGQGTTVTHTYENGGDYEAVAHITLASGDVVTLKKTIELQSPIVLDVSFEQGASVDNTDLSNAITLSSEVTLDGGESDTGLRLNGGTAHIEATEDFYNNPEYTFAFDFKKDPGGQIDAKIIEFSSSFAFFMQGDTMNVAVTTDQGGQWLRVDSLPIGDGEWHKVALTFSGSSGEVILYFDGKPVGKLTGLEGATQVGSQSHDLIIGDATGRSEFPGVVDNVKFLQGAVGPDHIMDLDSVAIGGTTGGTVETPTQSSDDEIPKSSDPAPVETEQDKSEAPDDGPEQNTDVWDSGNSTETPIIDESQFTKTQGSAENDVIKGGSGKRYADGGAGNDVIRTGGNDDVLIGGLGNDSLAGYGGNDVLIGGAGDDNLNAGDGDDLLIVDREDSQIRGGTGIDTMRIGVASPGTFELSKAYRAGIEIIDLSNDGQDIVLVDHKDANKSDTTTLKILGDLGDVVQLQNEMQLIGIVVRDGSDYFELVSEQYGVTRSFYVSTNLVLLDSSGRTLAGEENLKAYKNAGGELNSAFGSIFVEAPADNPNDLPSIDMPTFDNYIIGTDGDDVLKGGSGNNHTVGGAGNDSIRAGNEDDFVSGGTGNDSLASYAGNDTLDGGAGADSLLAGEGDDLLLFDQDDISLRGGEGFDTIQLAGPTVGTLNLSSIYIANVEKVDLSNDSHDIVSVEHRNAQASDTGYLQITGDTGDTVVLENPMTFTGVVQLGGESYFELSSTRFGDERNIYVDTDLNLIDQDGHVIAGLENLIAAAEKSEEIHDNLNSLISDPLDFL
ncbi:MAG: LamG-like jellyroll fold domain-containing protein [Pseudomonadota bacterium]